jgi:DivIVA domain-containing protein
MSSSGLDLPVLVTPEQIRRREFVQTRRGYETGQVRDYLEQIAGQVEQMQALLREARLEVDAAAKASSSKSDPYDQLASRVAEVLRAADRQAEQLRAGARAEAETILREARADADRIRLDAESNAEAAREQADLALREARERADGAMAGLASRRAALLDQLTSMQERLLSVARDLDEAIDRPGEAADGSTTFPPADEVAPAAGSGPDPAEQVIDLGTHELWAGGDVELQVPEIPPLDLDWDATDD